MTLKLNTNNSILLQEVNKLLHRVNTAKNNTEGALQRITGNTDELDDALNTLKGAQTNRWTDGDM